MPDGEPKPPWSRGRLILTLLAVFVGGPATLLSLTLGGAPGIDPPVTSRSPPPAPPSLPPFANPDLRRFVDAVDARCERALRQAAREEPPAYRSEVVLLTLLRDGLQDVRPPATSSRRFRTRYARYRAALEAEIFLAQRVVRAHDAGHDDAEDVGRAQNVFNSDRRAELAELLRFSGCLAAVDPS